MRPNGARYGLSRPFRPLKSMGHRTQPSGLGTMSEKFCGLKGRDNPSNSRAAILVSHPNPSGVQHEESCVRLYACHTNRIASLPRRNPGQHRMPLIAGRWYRRPCSSLVRPIAHPRYRQCGRDGKNQLIQMDQNQGYGVCGFPLAVRLWRILRQPIGRGQGRGIYPQPDATSPEDDVSG